MQDPDAIFKFVQSRIPAFESVEHARSLSGGMTNEVWRVSDGRRSVILKYAPPFVSFDPDTPLDDGRILTEERALSLFRQDPVLKAIVSEQIRPVRSLGLFEEEHTLMLEDLGNAPDLATWLGRSASAATLEAAAKILGTFFGRLHAVTAGGPKYADTFKNPTLQERRFYEYYNTVGPTLREADYPGWDEVDDKAQRLGLRLLDTGVCLTHGDLRAKDVHLVPTGLRLTDWECCHYGLPAQDVAQLSAHLWMHAHCARDMATKKRLRTFNSTFVGMYLAVVQTQAPRSFTDAEFYESHGVHFGCEIIARTIGEKRVGFLYEGVDKHEKIEDAVSVAVNSITGDAPFFRRD